MLDNKMLLTSLHAIMHLNGFVLNHGIVLRVTMQTLVHRVWGRDYIQTQFASQSIIIYDTKHKTMCSKRNKQQLQKHF